MIGAVGRGVLRLLLDEADVGAAAGDERRVERGAGHRWDRAGGGTLPARAGPALPPRTRLIPAATTATDTVVITTR